MHAENRSQSAPRRPARAVRPPRAPAHNWRTTILQHLPLLVACGLLVAGSAYVLTAQTEAAAASAQARP